MTLGTSRYSRDIYIFDDAVCRGCTSRPVTFPSRGTHSHGHPSIPRRYLAAESPAVAIRTVTNGKSVSLALA